ncbi:ABC transporter ATP-binding protein [Altererythrobacter lauratis]|uniref:ABC transporter ATP-binding protein n=1 Tax=Alteraurantiacibacter lauratis TaxID=2054627 RepID=A0ABV7EC57_9SPHN
MKPAYLLRQAAPYRRPLLTIAAVSLLTSAVTLVVPWLAGQLLGRVVEGSGTVAAAAGMGMGTILVLLVTALVAGTGLTIAGAILSAATGGRILADLRIAAHRHILRLPVPFHDNSNAGELLSLTTFEVASLSNFLANTLARMPAMLVTAAGASVLMFRLDPATGLVLLLLLPLFYLAVKLVGRRLRQLGYEARDAETALIVLAEQQLEMMMATKSFAQEQAQSAAFARLAEASRKVQLEQERLKAMLGPIVALLAGFAAILVLLLAGGAGEEARDPAELFSLLLYAALLTRPMGSLADLYGYTQWAGGTLARLEAVMAEAEERGYEDNVAGARRAQGALAFEDVRFAYPGRDATLDGISFAVAPGEIVALTGDNGAGKSTLISLLLRFYQPDSGRITLDGQEISTIPLQHLRRQIGLVPQRPLLFAGTVRENITYGLPDASTAQLAAAVELAQAQALVQMLPQGLETRIGDHGVRLSGGQRQRIALARALLADPPVLVFDEATSMFDLDAEASFVAACKEGLKGRTVLIVTHRPASLALADRIIDLHEGRIRTVTERHPKGA